MQISEFATFNEGSAACVIALQYFIGNGEWCSLVRKKSRRTLRLTCVSFFTFPPLASRSFFFLRLNTTKLHRDSFSVHFINHTASRHLEPVLPECNTLEFGLVSLDKKYLFLYQL